MENVRNKLCASLITHHRYKTLVYEDLVLKHHIASILACGWPMVGQMNNETLFLKWERVETWIDCKSRSKPSRMMQILFYHSYCYGRRQRSCISLRLSWQAAWGVGNSTSRMQRTTENCPSLTLPVSPFVSRSSSLLRDAQKSEGRI